MSNRTIKFSVFPAFVLTIVAALLLAIPSSYRLFGIDDANIFFTYAKNIAHGLGPVYSYGGQAVEGFSSILWLLISSAAFSVMSEPYFLLLAISIILCTLSVCNTHFIAIEYTNRSIPIHILSIAALGWLGFFPTFFLWNTLTLMDTGLWVCFLSGAIYYSLLVMKDYKNRFNKIILSLLCSVLIIIRPESIFWVPALLFCTGWSIFSTQKIQLVQLFKVIVLLSLPALIMAFILYLTRMHLFGYPLPNTYYAKVTPYNIESYIKGTVYFLRFLLSHPLITLACLAVPFQLYRHRRHRNALFFLPLYCLLAFILPILSGGDHFGSYRFYQILYPLLFSVFSAAIIELNRNIRFDFSFFTKHYSKRIVFSVACVFYGILIQPNWLKAPSESNLYYEFTIADQGRNTGMVLNSLFSKEHQLPDIGVITAGGIGFIYKGPLRDLMGLNDPLMAHLSKDRKGLKNHAIFDKTIFFKNPPKLMIPNEWKPTLHDPGYSNELYSAGGFNNQALKNLFFTKEFNRLYNLAAISDSMSNTGIIAFIRRDYLNYLQLKGYSIRTME